MGRKAKPEPKLISIIRYYDADGKRCKKSDPGAVKKKEQSETYYAEFPPEEKGGKPERISLETTDVTVAWKKLRDLLQERHDRALGLSNPRTKQLLRPIKDHLEDWLASVTAQKVTPDRIALMRSRMTALIDTADWRRISDIKLGSCMEALASLQETRKGCGGEGLSAQTRNHYLSHSRQFALWLFRNERLPSNPLVSAKGVSVASDRRHDRRCPGDEEIKVLFDYLAGEFPSHPPFIKNQMSGAQRALGYQLAMCSGLRAGELRSLKKESFELDSGQVRVVARLAKNRKRTAQALPRWLCDKLRIWLEKGGELWDRFPKKNPGRILREDLEQARNGWIMAGADEAEKARRTKSDICVYEIESVDGSLFFDFHALRHWYISQLAAQDGISPSTLQSLSRHSDPKLTLGTYAKAKEDGTRAAVDRLRIPGEE